MFHSESEGAPNTSMAAPVYKYSVTFLLVGCSVFSWDMLVDSSSSFSGASEYLS